RGALQARHADVLDAQRGRPDRQGLRRRGRRRQDRAALIPDAGTRQEASMLISTTSTLDGKPITSYLGLVSGGSILGATIFKDIFAGIRDIVGGRSHAYEQELRKAKDIAVREMVEQAQALGANAVVGVDLDYENVGQSGGMLVASASGTAAVLRTP